MVCSVLGQCGRCAETTHPRRPSSHAHHLRKASQVNNRACFCGRNSRASCGSWQVPTTAFQQLRRMTWPCHPVARPPRLLRRRECGRQVKRVVIWSENILHHRTRSVSTFSVFGWAHSSVGWVCPSRHGAQRGRHPTWGAAAGERRRSRSRCERRSAVAVVDAAGGGGVMVGCAATAVLSRAGRRGAAGRGGGGGG